MPTSPYPRGDVELQIKDVAFGGAGVARSGGKIVFVPLTIDDEEVEAQIVEQKRSFDRAELRKVLRASPRRVEPLCRYFGRCGGCDYQHIAYDYQLELKRRQVSELLRRVGQIANPSVSAVIPCRKPYAFRNRITVHSGNGRIGFFAKNSRTLVDIERCEIAVPEVNKKLSELRTEGLPDGFHRTLREDGVPLSFTQTNSFVAAELRQYVSEQLTGKVLLDTYCGSGFFGHAFAGRFEKVIGLDWSEHAIARARSAAADNEHYICANVAEALPMTLVQDYPQIVIMDPPAEGIEKEVAEALATAQLERLIYVSCNPATLARDLARLRGRFEVKSIQPFDMFPQTAEIETVAVLEGRMTA